MQASVSDEKLIKKEIITMSIVCCRVTKEYIEIASDSISVRGWTQEKGKDKFSKLCKINELIIGSVGYAEEASLLQMYSKSRKPEAASEDAILIFLGEFVEWKKKRTDKSDLSNSYIIIFEKKAFYISDFFVTEILEYEAIGAGEDFALAALFLNHDTKKATKTACELSIYCEEPIIYFKIDRT